MVTSERKEMKFNLLWKESYKPIWRLHFVAMHEYKSKMGKIAAISRYIIPQPSKQIMRNIGLETLNTLSLRWWKTYSARTMVKKTQNREMTRMAILWDYALGCYDSRNLFVIKIVPERPVIRRLARSCIYARFATLHAWQTNERVHIKSTHIREIVDECHFHYSPIETIRMLSGVETSLA